MYYNRRLSMREVGEELGVSLDAVVHFMRKYNLPRRSFSEVNADRFEKKPLSFSPKKNLSRRQEELVIAGIMLYWAEGYKSDNSSFVDFANSDPAMVKVFMNFIRGAYKVSEGKFRVLLYCYSDQDVNSLVSFWSKLTGIPRSRFVKPYVRPDFRKGGRKMEHGLVHIRYIDKKLLLEIKKLINNYKVKFAQVVP